VARGDHQEISELTGCDVHDFASAAVAGRRLRELGPRIVVVQAGDEGDLVLAPDVELRLAYLPVEGVDPTGGGDALIAALAVLLGRVVALGRSARLASAAAAHTVSHLGARPSFADVHEPDALITQYT